MVNVTHGFPQNPAPLFRSTQFPIENRPGLEDQSLELVLRRLAQLEAPSVEGSPVTKPGEEDKRQPLAEWLSDWHLIAFLGTTHLISTNDLKTFMRAVSSPTLPSQLDTLLATESWKMLMSLTVESAPAKPTTAAPTTSHDMDEDIPQGVFDQIAAEEAARESDHPATRNVKVCPHCTFENEPGGSDCAICGLPL